MRALGWQGPLLAAVLLLGGLATPSIARAGGLASSPWPMYQQNEGHTGESASVGPTTPAQRWRFAVNGVPGSPVIGADGTVYVPTGGEADRDPGALYAVNPDGSPRWRFQFPVLGVCEQIAAASAPAVADDGTIYVHTQAGYTPSGERCISGDSYLFAVNPGGTEKWHFQFNDGGAVLKGGALSSPVIGEDGTIFVGSADTGLYAVNPDGSERWAVSPELTSISSSPALGPDGTVYVNISGRLYAYEPDGDLKWVANLGGNCCIASSASVASDGTIYFCGIGPAACHAVSPAGTKLWSTPFEAGDSTPAIAPGGPIYLVTGNPTNEGTIAAVENDGTERWRRNLGSSPFWVNSPSLGGDGRIYTLLNEGLLPSGGGFGDVLFALGPDGSESGRANIPGDGAEDGDLGLAIGSDGTVYAAEPNAGFDYDPDANHLAAYTQGQPDDSQRPALRLGGRRVQNVLRQRGVIVQARCPTEECTATATGRVVGASTYKLRRARKQIASGNRARLKLRASRRTLRAVRSALADGKRVRAKITVAAEDEAGNSRKKKLRVRVKPPRGA